MFRFFYINLCFAVPFFIFFSFYTLTSAQPGPPLYVSVSAGPASVHFSLKTTPVSGGTPITSFVLQWKEKPTEQWKENTFPATGKTPPLSSRVYASVIIYTFTCSQVKVLWMSEWAVRLEYVQYLMLFVCFCRSSCYQPQAVHFVHSTPLCTECSGTWKVLWDTQRPHTGNT